MGVVIIANSGTSKNDQKCAVVVELQDLDTAYSLAGMLGHSLDACAGGGDWEIDGETIGHDVVGAVKLVTPGVTPIRPACDRGSRYFAPIEVRLAVTDAKPCQWNLLQLAESACLLSADIARTCEVHDIRLSGMFMDGENGERFFPIDANANPYISSNNRDDMELIWSAGRLVYNTCTGTANLFRADDQPAVKELLISIYLVNRNLR